MNRIAYTAFVAFWASLATLLAFALLSEPRPSEPPQRAATLAEEPSERSEAPSDGMAELPVVSLRELARNDTRESCWKAIHGMVYDVTDFIDDHPTPPSVMIEWCGRESSAAWDDKAGGRPHSRMAARMLEEYLVGRLEDANGADEATEATTPPDTKVP